MTAAFGGAAFYAVAMDAYVYLMQRKIMADTKNALEVLKK
jgi:hypothetical protein